MLIHRRKAVKNGLRGVESDGYSWHYISIARLGTRLWKCDSERNYRKGGMTIFETGFATGLIVGLALALLGVALYIDVKNNEEDDSDGR